VRRRRVDDDDVEEESLTVEEYIEEKWGWKMRNYGVRQERSSA
jgi:hypothetical protein